MNQTKQNEQQKPKAKTRRVLTDQEKLARDAVKAAKFKALYAKRMPRLVKALGSIERLANRQTYSYTAEQAAKVIKVIESYAVMTADAFRGKAQSKETFTI